MVSRYPLRRIWQMDWRAVMTRRYWTHSILTPRTASSEQPSSPWHSHYLQCHVRSLPYQSSPLFGFHPAPSLQTWAGQLFACSDTRIILIARPLNVLKIRKRQLAVKVPKRTDTSATSVHRTLLKNHPKNRYITSITSSSDFSVLTIPFYTRALSCPTPILDWCFQVNRARKSLDGGITQITRY